MSIDFCDVKHGTSFEIGKSINIVFPGSNDGRETTTLQRGLISSATNQEADRDILISFKVPIDLRAISFSFAIDDLWDPRSRHTNPKSLGLELIAWPLYQEPLGLFDIPPTPSTANRIFSTKSFPKSSITIINKGYEVSDNMRKRGFNMDPCYPLTNSFKYVIKQENYAHCNNIEKLRFQFMHCVSRCKFRFNKIVILGQPSTIAFNSISYRSLAGRILNHKPEIPKTPVKGCRRRNYGFGSTSSSSRGQQMIEASARQHENDIPTEYLDPFTDRLMEFPMLLPCGKLCDKSYLDKYARLEKKWLRKMTDPFTGRYFNIDQTAIPAVDLKKQIDKWWLLKMFGTLPEWYQE